MDFGHRHGDARRSSLLLPPSSADGYFATQASLLAGRGRAVGPRFPPLHRKVSEEEISASYRELTKEFNLRDKRSRREAKRERWLAELQRQVSVYPELLTIEYLNQLYHRMDVGFGGTLTPSLPPRSEVGFGDRLTPPPPHLQENMLGEMRREIKRERWLAELRRQASVCPELLTIEYLNQLYHRMDVGFGGTLTPSLPHRPEVGFSDSPHRSEVGLLPSIPPRSEVGFGGRLTPPPPPHLLENMLGEMLPPSLTHPLENGLGGRLPPSLPHHLELEFGGSLPPSLPHHLEVGFGERLLPSRPRHLEFTERPPPLPCHNPVIRENPHVRHAESVIKNKSRPHRKPREQEEIILTKGKMPKKSTGIKRKAETIAVTDDISQPAKKSWSCSLCQVSATCEQGLKEHLKGKKHKAMEGSLETNIVTAENSGTSTSLAKEVDKAKEAGMPLMAIKAKESYKPVQAKVAPVKGPAEKNTSGVKRQKQEVQQQESFWCEVCKVKYNSQALLDSHLNGKKHKAQVEHPLKNKKPVEGEESQKDNQLVKDDKPVEADESGKSQTY